MSYNKRLVYSGAFLLGVLMVAYANHYNNEFHFDDTHTVVNNIFIRTLGNISRFFVDPSMFSVDPHHQALRPLVTASLAIDYQIGGGLHPWAFHLSTFLWHIGLCVMLFFLYRNLLSKTVKHKWISYIALIGAGWFGNHVVAAETINYIIARSDVLSTFMIVASLLIFIIWPKRRKYLLYMLPAIVGIFAKETVPVLPVLLFFYIVFFEKDWSIRDLFARKNSGAVGRIFLQLTPITVVIGFVQWRVLSASVGSSISAHIPHSLGHYLLTQPYVWFRYFRAFFLPYDLSADSDMQVLKGFSDPLVYIGLLFLTLLVLAIFKTSRNTYTRPIAFGLIWFAVALLPTSLIPLADVARDQRMYFAFVGLTLSVVAALGLLAIKKQHYFQSVNRQKWLLAVVFLIITANAFGVYQRNKVWRTEESLWKDVTEKSPGNARGWSAYGWALMSSYDFDAAIEAHKKAVAIDPGYGVAFSNLGVAYAALGDSAAAVQNFTKAISLYPGEYSCYVDFARYYLERNDFLRAKDLTEKALSLNSRSYLARDLAMGVYQGLGMWQELERLALSTLDMLPGDAKTLQYLRAAKERRTLVAHVYTYNLNSSSVEGLLALSLKQYNEESYEDCIKTCNRLLKLDPTNADAYNNICSAYNMLKQWEQAKAACTKALELNPQHPNAGSNLKWATDRGGGQ